MALSGDTGAMRSAVTGGAVRSMSPSQETTVPTPYPRNHVSGRVGDQVRSTGVVDHVLHTVGGRIGAERHVLAARGYDGVDGHDHFHAAVDAYTDRDVRSDTGRISSRARVLTRAPDSA